MNIWQSLKAFSPELCMAAGLIVLFVLDLGFQPGSRQRRPVAFFVCLAILFVAGLLLVIGRPIGPASFFQGLVVVDGYALFFRALFIVTVGIVAILSYFSSEVEQPREGEFFAMLLAVALAMCTLASSSHLLMIYLSVEFLSITSYILPALKKRDPRTSEAALKYAVYGSMASGLMLFGFSYLYGLTGTLDLAGISEKISAMSVSGAQAGWGMPERLLSSLILVSCLAGLGFKIAAVPFHMWCPDVYEGAPTPVTALLSVGPKAAGFAVLLRFFVTAMPSSELPWPVLIGLLAAVTMTLGNLAALVQSNVKRLLAYSSIAQAGYLLMAVSANTEQATQSLLFYLMVYLFMNLGAFLVLVIVREEKGKEDVEAFAGLGHRNPLAAITMTVFLFSLVGLPPLGGFIGKFFLFAAVLKKATPGFDALALLGVLNSAISLYYYARIVKAMFFQEGEEMESSPSRWPLHALALGLAVVVVVLGLYWGPMMSWAGASVLAQR